MWEFELPKSVVSLVVQMSVQTNGRFCFNSYFTFRTTFQIENPVWLVNKFALSPKDFSSKNQLSSFSSFGKALVNECAVVTVKNFIVSI